MFRKSMLATVAVSLVLSGSPVLAQRALEMAPTGGEQGIIIINGRVTAAKGNTLTIRDEAGRVRSVDVKDAGGIKAGDTITVRDGQVEKSR